MSERRLGVAVGEMYADGYTDGLRWLVAEIDQADKVWLAAFKDGEPTGAIMEWPRNRWFALVDKQGLTLIDEDAEAA